MNTETKNPPTPPQPMLFDVSQATGKPLLGQLRAVVDHTGLAVVMQLREDGMPAADAHLWTELYAQGGTPVASVVAFYRRAEKALPPVIEEFSQACRQMWAAETEALAEIQQTKTTDMKKKVAKTDSKNSTPAVLTLVDPPALTGAWATEPTVILLPPRAIAPDPSQPRKDFPAASLDELAASLKETGQLQNVIVRQPWPGEREKLPKDVTRILVCGERRWRSAPLAGLKQLRCDDRGLMTEKEVKQAQFVENQQRENVSDLDEAAGYERSIADLHTTPEEFAKSIGKARSHVYGRLRLLRLHGPVKEALLKGLISTSVAGAIATVPTPSGQARLLEEIVGAVESYGEVMTFKDAVEKIQSDYCRALKDTVFKQGERYQGTITREMQDMSPEIIDRQEQPLPGLPLDLEVIGPCTTCPRRTGNMLEQFPELKDRPNVCTDPACFRAKEKVALALQRKVAEEKGVTVLGARESAKVFNTHSWQPPLRADGPAVDLSAVCPADPKGRTYKQILGKAAPAPALAEKDGKLVPVILKADVAAVLADKGIKLKEKAPEVRESAAQQEAKSKLVRAKKEAVAAAALELLLQQFKQEQTVEVLRIIAKGNCHNHYYLERHGMNNSSKGTLKTVEEHVDSLSEAELRVALMEVKYCSRPVDYNDNFSDEFTEACKHYGIDLKKMEKEITAKKEPEEKKGGGKGKG